MFWVWFFSSAMACIVLCALCWRRFAATRYNALDRVMHSIVQANLGDGYVPRQSHEKTISWVSFYVATDQPWGGQRIVDVLVAQGLSLDEDNLFSYRMDGCTWFRVAQATQPVHFDMARLADTAISGLAFFMDANEVEYPRVVFHKMVEILKDLAIELNGLLVDQSRQALTPEDFERIGKQLPKYEDALLG